MAATTEWTVRIILIPAVPSFVQTPLCQIHWDGRAEVHVYPPSATVEEAHRQEEVIAVDRVQRAEDPGEAAKLAMDSLAAIAARVSFMAVRSYRVAGLRVGVSLPDSGFATVHEVWWVPRAGAVGPRALLPGLRMGEQTAVQSMLRCDLDDQTERAMQWLWHGLGAFEATAQFMAYWIGLEVLAPPVKSPWQCPACRSALPECPSCGASTERSTQGATMRSFLLGLGASEQLITDMVELRHAVFHGRMRDDAKVHPTALAIDSGRLLQRALKRRLHLPDDGPPDLGQPAVTLDGFAPIGRLADDERIAISFGSHQPPETPQ